uniref:Uncharacterized protein n=1 Tax=Anopheles christyi TaxID=43041 RepID=A0A182JRK9_9DIPT
MPSFGKDNAPLRIRRLPGFRVMYPTLANVLQSHDGLVGGHALPYTEEVHQEQKWLQSYLYQWISRARHLNKAMPQIKTYCRSKVCNGFSSHPQTFPNPPGVLRGSISLCTLITTNLAYCFCHGFCRKKIFCRWSQMASIPSFRCLTLLIIIMYLFNSMHF